MDFVPSLSLCLFALVIEAAIGYPQPLFARIGHPVTWIGALIAWLDRHLNHPDGSFAARRATGILALLILLAISGGIAIALSHAAHLAGWFGSLILLPLVASSLIAQRSLYTHVAAVRDGTISGGLPAGRKAVAMIVGRNPDVLDEAGVSRAAIESLAENFSDGITAPTFWLAVLGLPGAVLYKATNTADSMIGHKSERYHAFGWAAARFDDLVNLPASRLTALFLILSSFGPGYSMRGACDAVRRDARHHKSPNAGWPESAMAGALGLKLNGPRIYGDELIDDVYMGNGRREATAADIDRALILYRRALVLQFLLVAFCIGLTAAFR